MEYRKRLTKNKIAVILKYRQQFQKIFEVFSNAVQENLAHCDLIFNEWKACRNLVEIQQRNIYVKWSQCFHNVYI